jgi:succinoglycan biosynthesis transport protein ExoP
VIVELRSIDWDDKPGLLKSAWRYKRLLAALLALGLLVGLGASLIQPKLYAGACRVLLILPTTGNVEPTRYVLNQTELIKSQAVLARAVKLAGRDLSPDVLRGRLSMETTSDRDLITISVLDSTPEGAKALAESVGRAYEEVLEADSTSEAAQLEQSRTTLSRQLAAATATLTANPADREAQTRVTTLQSRLDQIVAQQGALNDGQANGGVYNRDPLPAATSPAQPETARNMLAGALLGLLIGMGLAWWLNGRSETRITETDEAARLLGLPILARVPVPARQQRDRLRPVMLDDPETVEAEAFRFLRNSFTAAARRQGAKVVMVTSGTEQEGKSIIAANLALALARAGSRVALVDLDLRRPAQRRLLELPEGPGFTEVALGRTQLERALHRLMLVDTERKQRRLNPAGENGNGHRSETGLVEVLTAGSRPKVVGEFVGSSATADVIEQLKNRMDIVLIDAPPMLRVGDALSLMPVVDALLVVARLNVAQRKSLSELRRILDTSGATMLGAVVNGVSADDTYTRPYGVATKLAGGIQRSQSGPQAKPAPRSPVEPPGAKTSGK